MMLMFVCMVMQSSGINLTISLTYAWFRRVIVRYYQDCSFCMRVIAGVAMMMYKGSSNKAREQGYKK